MWYITKSFVVDSKINKSIWNAATWPARESKEAFFAGSFRVS